MYPVWWGRDRLAMEALDRAFINVYSLLILVTIPLIQFGCNAPINAFLFRIRIVDEI